MRKASLGTLFLTVFLDLLGFGLVVPFLPGVARDLGASDFMATLVGPLFSLMQFLFIPLWGRLSDRVGRRPVLLWSIAASMVGMILLGLARSLPLLFLARIWSGIATANIAVAQAYIADVTTPDTRAKGMGLIGIGFGLGFIFGPALGGQLGQYEVMGQAGTLAALFAAGLSAINFGLAYFTLPESLPDDRRGQPITRRRVLDVHAVREVARRPGMAVALAISFLVIFWFSGLEITFRLFTVDAFGMSMAGTGYLFAFVGVVAVLVQGGLIHRLTRRWGELSLIRTGLLLLGLGFALDALSPDIGSWFLYCASALIAVGNGLYNPSLSSYTSRQASADTQGMTLGVMQSMSALARAVGPLAGGLVYEFVGMRGPYIIGAIGLMFVFALAFRLPPIASSVEIVPPAQPPARALRTTSM
jgi:MFS transporter, DHA1 family, tetracycline resistance protein